jgi:hypothetical protein
MADFAAVRPPQLPLFGVAHPCVRCKIQHFRGIYDVSSLAGFASATGRGGLSSLIAQPGQAFVFAENGEHVENRR